MHDSLLQEFQKYNLEMAANELISFVFMFKNLWRNGQEKTLNMKTEYGKAWFEVRAGLGYPVDLPTPP